MPPNSRSRDLDTVHGVLTGHAAGDEVLALFLARTDCCRFVEVFAMLQRIPLCPSFEAPVFCAFTLGARGGGTVTNLQKAWLGMRARCSRAHLASSASSSSTTRSAALKLVHKLEEAGTIRGSGTECMEQTIGVVSLADP
jgi:hypothetical protein